MGRAGTNLGNIWIDSAQVTVRSATLQVGSVAFAAATDRFIAPDGSLLVSGNWDDAAGTASSRLSGTVVFDGTATELLNSGGAAFNNLTIAKGATVSLRSDVVVTGVFVDRGRLIANGHMIRH